MSRRAANRLSLPAETDHKGDVKDVPEAMISESYFTPADVLAWTVRDTGSIDVAHASTNSNSSLEYGRKPSAIGTRTLSTGSIGGFTIARGEPTFQ